MRSEKKIFLYWMLTLVLLRIGLEFPHREFQWIGLVDAAAQLLLFILALALCRTSKGVQRGAMLNLALFFGFVIPLLATAFVGESIFRGDPYARAYSHLYINIFGVAFTSFLTIFYFASAYLFPRRPLGFHYPISIAAAAGMLMLFFGGYIIDPVSISAEPDYADAASVGMARDSVEAAGFTATPESITSILVGRKWKDRTYEEALPRTIAMLPYLEDGRLTTLYWRPIEYRRAALNFFCLVVIILVLTKMFNSGLAYSAYSDKILIALGFLHAFEAFHYYASAQSISWLNYMTLLEAGHYFTISILVFTIATLNFKLRFSTQGAGQYYDRAIALNPSGTTRFIDEIDALILRTFFSKPRKHTMGSTSIQHDEGERQ